MKKLLFYGDSPIATTGQGRLHRYLLKEFSKDYEITVVGVNHNQIIVTPEGKFAVYDKKEFPYKIISTYLTDDLLGIQTMKRLLQQDFDLIFTSSDYSKIISFTSEILDHKLKYNSKWVLYTPIDYKYVPKEEKDTHSLPDKTIFLSKYAHEKLGLGTYIYHPVLLDEFPKITQKERCKFRNEFFNKWDKYKIIGNINRNQFRKDPLKTLEVFNKVYEQDQSYRLYMHCKPDDNGINLGFIMHQLGVDPNTVMFAQQSSAMSGVSQEVLNKIYWSLDVGISTSTGEGFGYSTVEYMATKRPIVVPNNTSFSELVQGELIDCNEDVVFYGNGNVIRSRVDTGRMAESILNLDNQYVEQHYQFVKNKLNLEEIMKQWEKVFKEL